MWPARHTQRFLGSQPSSHFNYRATLHADPHVGFGALAVARGEAGRLPHDSEVEGGCATQCALQGTRYAPDLMIGPNYILESDSPSTTIRLAHSQRRSARCAASQRSTPSTMSRMRWTSIIARSLKARLATRHTWRVHCMRRGCGNAKRAIGLPADARCDSERRRYRHIRYGALSTRMKPLLYSEKDRAAATAPPAWKRTGSTRHRRRTPRSPVERPLPTIHSKGSHHDASEHL